MVHGLETMARLNAEASKPPGSDVDQIRSLQHELAEAKAEIDSLKSRASLTPLTDESVRGVLVDVPLHDAETMTLYGKPVRLRPASEFGVPSTPAEPAQKLVPLPEGAVVYRPASIREGGVTLPFRPGEWINCDPALYGVDAERVRELEAQNKQLCADLERVADERDGLASVPDLRPEVERLRKAWWKVSDDLHGELAVVDEFLCCTSTVCGKDNERRRQHGKREGLKFAISALSALTPPTAASGETCVGFEGTRVSSTADESDPEKPRDPQGLPAHKSALSEPTPSAPAAESEGGDGWQSHKIHFDAREMAALESLAEGYGHTTWPDAIVRCKAERDSLSARLAACEERCKELEAGLRFIGSDPGLSIASRFFYDQLLAPKAEGGRA